MNVSNRLTHKQVIQDLLPLVAETSPFPMVIVNADGIILIVNSQAETVFCYDQQHLVHQPIETLFKIEQKPLAPSASPSPFIELWRGCLQDTKKLTGLRVQGESFPVEVSLRPFKSDEQVLLLATCLDLTHHEWAKSEFQELSRHQQFILNSVGEGIYGLNPKGQITFMNPAGANMIGWEPQELIGKAQQTVISHSPSNESANDFQDSQIFAAYKDGQIHHDDHEVFWRKDGSSFPVEYTSTPMKNEHGETLGAVITFRDITQRKQIEEADRVLRVMKDEFIATASHELKTPLASLQGFMKLLLSGKVKDPAVQSEFLTRANQDIERLHELIRDLLDTSKLESGQRHFEREELALHPLIQETCLSLEQLAKEKNMVIQQDLSAEPLIIKADRSALQRVLVNLLKNAINYSDAQTTIQITSCVTGQAVEIKVIDQGPGLPQEEAIRLFEKFYQAKSIAKRADGGSGLGLFISKQIIEGHGGDITVNSQVGNGTTFIITLPASDITEKIPVGSSVLSRTLQGEFTR